MNPLIKKQSTAKEYYFQEGCFILEVSNSADDPSMSIVRARVEPGVTTRWHRLKKTVERYYIIEGQGVVGIGDNEKTKVSVGDVVLIPAMCRQRITNVGEKDLVFLAMCTPPFLEENYEDLENELR